MPSGIYKRTQQMKTGKYIRSEWHKKINSIALKKAGIKPPSRKGIPWTLEMREKICKALKGKNTWSKGRPMHLNTKKALLKAHIGKRLSKEHRLKISASQVGSKSYNWKGGKSSTIQRIKMGIEYRLWREAVFARDNWTCQECKVKGVYLHAHHIKPFSQFPELRFALDNGITLCVNCHQKQHKEIKFNGKYK